MLFCPIFCNWSTKGKSWNFCCLCVYSCWVKSDTVDSLDAAATMWRAYLNWNLTVEFSPQSSSQSTTTPLSNQPQIQPFYTKKLISTTVRMSAKEPPIFSPRKRALVPRYDFTFRNGWPKINGSPVTASAIRWLSLLARMETRGTTSLRRTSSALSRTTSREHATALGKKARLPLSD